MMPLVKRIPLPRVLAILSHVQFIAFIVLAMTVSLPVAR